MQCNAIKEGGERCKATATYGKSYCWNHDPDNAAKRSARGRKGGKAKGASGELVQVKREIKRIIAAIENRELEPKVANSIFYGWSLMMKAVEMEHSVQYDEEVAEKVEQLWGERKRKAS